MSALDADLASIQEARSLVLACRAAQREFQNFSQEQVDRVCAAMADAVYRDAARLGRLAHEETGYGVAAHKKLKVEFASRAVWDSIRDQKTVGVISRDDELRIIEIGWPMGVVVGLCPSTNPNSTAVFKTLISVKARNGIIIAPHPSAAQCTIEAMRVMVEAGERAGMPRGLVSCMTKVSLQGTQELMNHYATSVILATGGTPMVRAAHSTGKPALGVGPGNVPAYVDRSADIPAAAYAIVNSKAFDCSVICATEQAVVADRPIATQLRAEMVRNGAYWVPPEDKPALAKALFTPSLGMDASAVGRTPQALAKKAGISVPLDARILVADLDSVGRQEPLSGEKLTTVLGFYEVDGWHSGCERALELLHYGGDGHSLVIHAQDEEVILAFGIEKPAFRILVNTWGSLGAIGATTGLMPSLTLGPGGVGGAIVGDNITTRHLLNVKRVAWPLRDPPAIALELAPDVRRPGGPPPPPGGGPSAQGFGSSTGGGSTGGGPSDEQLDRIVARVMSQLKT